VKLIYEDLFGFAEGLCHLRVYADDAGPRVALVVNLEDNPGSGAVNAAEALLDRVAAVFGGQCRVFSIFPEFEGDPWTEVWPPGPDGRVAFRTDVSQAETEHFVDAPVSVPGPAECRAVDGPSAPGADPEEEDEPGVLAEMEIVAVADLPWAHLPSKCANFSDFETIRALYGGGREGEAPAGAHFFLGLDADRLAACHYHDYDWRVIAEAAVELFAQVGPDADRDDIRREASHPACYRRAPTARS
jgi:hypothetical protein